MFEPRPFQVAAVAALRHSLASGHRAPILVSPTGSGKTVMAAGIIHGALSKNRRVLFLAPRRELIRQASQTLARFGIRHGVIMAGEDLVPAQVQVASWDTLRSWIKRERIRPPSADVVIVDEAHLSLASTYRAILAEHYSGVAKIGLTATPARGDGRPLAGVYDDLVEAATVRELIDAGYLVPLRYFAPTKPDLEGLRIVRGDYDAKSIGNRFNTPQIVGDVIHQWFRIARDRQTVVFAGTVAHAAHIAERFRESGIAAEHIHCNMTLQDRDAVLDRVARQRTQVIVNVGILTFGYDQPSISCAVLARPTKSLVYYFQTVGRVLRPAPGKKDAIVIDHGGVVDELGFVDEPVPWTLEGNDRIQDAHNRKRKERKQPSPVTCGECGQTFEARKRCPGCGWETPEKVLALAVYDGDLQELDRQKKRANREWTPEQKAAFYGELKGYARSKGYADGWASNKYRERFGVWPNSYRSAPAKQPTVETLNWIRSRQIAWAKSKQRRAA